MGVRFAHPHDHLNKLGFIRVIPLRTVTIRTTPRKQSGKKILRWEMHWPRRAMPRVIGVSGAMVDPRTCKTRPLIMSKLYPPLMAISLWWQNYIMYGPILSFNPLYGMHPLNLEYEAVWNLSPIVWHSIATIRTILTIQLRKIIRTIPRLLIVMMSMPSPAWIL